MNNYNDNIDKFIELLRNGDNAEAKSIEDLQSEMTKRGYKCEIIDNQLMTRDGKAIKKGDGKLALNAKVKVSQGSTVPVISHEYKVFAESFRNKSDNDNLKREEQTVLARFSQSLAQIDRYREDEVGPYKAMKVREGWSADEIEIDKVEEKLHDQDFREDMHAYFLNWLKELNTGIAAHQNQLKKKANHQSASIHHSLLSKLEARKVKVMQLGKNLGFLS